MSDRRSVLAGVPQGSLLGPILFNVFADDITGSPPGGSLLAYAGVVLLIFSCPRASILNRNTNPYLEEQRVYYHRWRLRVSVPKSSAMVFKGKLGAYPNFRDFVPRLKFGDEVVTVSGAMNYLGVVFDRLFEFVKSMRDGLCV